MHWNWEDWILDLLIHLFRPTAGPLLSDSLSAVWVTGGNYSLQILKWKTLEIIHKLKLHSIQNSMMKLHTIHSGELTLGSELPIYPLVALSGVTRLLWYHSSYIQVLCFYFFFFFFIVWCFDILKGFGDGGQTSSLILPNCRGQQMTVQTCQK